VAAGADSIVKFHGVKFQDTFTVYGKRRFLVEGEIQKSKDIEVSNVGDSSLRSE